jgi:methionyl aminopeptidase
VILEDGDIIGLDIGMQYKGLFTDTAITVAVGKISPIVQKLLDVTEKSLKAAIAVAKVGNTIGDIGFATQQVIENAGFNVVRDLVGHGVGYEVHEDPMVPGYGKKGKGEPLLEGMVLAIEPMVVTGSYRLFMDDDLWTIRTADGGLSAHFEHTVAITAKGASILT